MAGEIALEKNGSCSWKKLRGLSEDEALAAQQQAEDLAVGGLRDALKSIDKLTFLQEFGRNMGIELESALEL